MKKSKVTPKEGEGAAVCRQARENAEQGRENVPAPENNKAVSAALNQEAEGSASEEKLPAPENKEAVSAALNQEAEGSASEEKLPAPENKEAVSAALSQEAQEGGAGITSAPENAGRGEAQAGESGLKERASVFFKEKTLPALKRLPKRWFIDAFTGMAQGLFVTLIAGTIVKTLGGLIGDNAFGNFLTLLGNIASVMMGAGIGAGMGSKLKAPGLVVFSAIVAGFVGAWSDVFITCAADGSSSVLAAIGQKVAAGSPGNPLGA